jgi:hypothetical protein
MNLHEEYWKRKKVKAPLVQYVDRANLILRAKGKSEWGWLHVNVASIVDGQHPTKYNFVVSANPSLYATSDMNHFSQQSKMIQEYTWEWEGYEPGLIEWSKKHAGLYHAVTSQDAILVAWEIFITNYDSWIAHFMPFRMQDTVYRAVSDETPLTDKLAAIKDVEDYLREKYERVFVYWKNIKGAIEQKNYADWLAKIVNDMAVEVAN